MEVTKVSKNMAKDMQNNIKDIISEAIKEFPNDEFGKQCQYIRDALKEDYGEGWNVIILKGGACAVSGSLKGTSITIDADDTMYKVFQSPPIV